jgi:radical SAM superfamily enzyme YgiQ (UPF0313 family)
MRWRGHEPDRRRQILVLCAHLHEDRAAKRDRDFLQANIGLHLGSLIDREKYEVRLYQEMWHGPFRVAQTDLKRYALVFLSGLQMDFDRMRQLSFWFKRAGVSVVAGGSSATLFPEYASQFFDAVCVGGVECVAQVMKDFEAGKLKPIYRSAQRLIARYTIDHSLLWENGIRVPVHFIEASRGCNFKCDFCSIPAEGARHATYHIDDIRTNISDAIATSPWWWVKRWYPMVWFIDNNFANDLSYVREICKVLGADRRIKIWGALVTQDLLYNDEILQLMAQSKCRGIFTGIESFDENVIISHDKRQNLKNRGTIRQRVEFAERLGIMVVYGYIFDPRLQTVAQMRRELFSILQSDYLNFPYFIGFVAPLVGTPLFWNCAAKGELLPNLRLRDLDGRCIAYRNALNTNDALSRFAFEMFSRPWVFTKLSKIVRQVASHAIKTKLKSPVLTYLRYENRARLLRLGRKHTGGSRRNYIGGEDILDPQYRDYPHDISGEDWRRYFAPVMVTDGDGRPASWLEGYAPSVASGSANFAPHA